MNAPDTPLPRSPREELDALIASGSAEAVVALREYWLADPNLGRSAFVLSRFEQLRSRISLLPFRVTVLRSFTVEPVLPVLRCAAFEAGLDLTCQVGDFNAYAQEILSPDSLVLACEANLILLAVQARDVAPRLWAEFARLDASDVPQLVEETSAELVNLVRALRRRSSAAIVVHNLQVPSAPGWGVLDAQLATGQRAAFQQINCRLAAAVRELEHVYLLDYDALVARHGDEPFHDERLWLTARLPLATSRIADLARAWMRFIHPLSGRVAKVLAVDLDNTLWGGVIGEEGPSGIRLGPESPGAHYQALQRTLLDLKARGVVLAICSKNNPDDALPVFDSHPGMLLRRDDFAAIRINWDDKASNLRAIAQELNIGLESIAFLDDNPAERRWIRSQLPQCPVLELPPDPAGYARAVRDWGVFERLRLTREDTQRARAYLEERERQALHSTASSLEDFYRQLRISVTIDVMTTATLPRVAQLTQKTNQFNLTTRRYTEQQLAQLQQSPDWRIYTLSAADRFGENGLVAVAILRIDPAARRWSIDTLLMSCRVIGRTIESAFLAALVQFARAGGATALHGEFIPTPKNGPAARLYESHGFHNIESPGDRSAWILDLTPAGAEIATPAWIEVQLRV